MQIKYPTGRNTVLGTEVTKFHGIKSSESWEGKVAFTGNPEWGQSQCDQPALLLPLCS